MYENALSGITNKGFQYYDYEYFRGFSLQEFDTI